MSLPVVLSGIQPSGTIHLGNYLGAVRNWVEIQNSYSCFFCIADLHALTSRHDTKSLLFNTMKLLATYLACGIDPHNAIIFTQSHISEHTELCWLLSCITPLGWLNRMTQFKEKGQSASSLGLYSYPVLMAADILLYKTNFVPVGSDQQQHLELARDIAKTFNTLYNTEYFQVPSPIIYNNTARIMSLKNGTKKMSKSDASDYSRINLDDEDNVILQKITKATTDSILGFEFDTLKNRPEINNLINIYSNLADIPKEKLCSIISNYNTQKFKNMLLEMIIHKITPIRKKIKELLSDIPYLKTILNNGNEQAKFIAHTHIKEIKYIIGFYT
ncbi:tryptophan--tRNA ligase [Neoehrlichia mikurensis]|uniref:Tryptophan--tRNA ligase n=1 Tax=Neoehrlichia mikurensis TaxID=89586 RepID=A0A9Q9BUJ5_9RICK|nr:tryptophan--tRNA ligase [Neoehrlichia mikurensis]QXK92234.1 tryptophan--tRNA ligase [Neoehrlichia mikurensis]QXK92689.1 tryptophan--tRNA ligase [Neoehrlichia mikurensis]QXK93927.1 tryptophan--tRNA ligase [Neoehrlichia mikurensis]UTO55912.1 tryptophan--tRNA ligase [Neoehrlichia mikurensis]UTO56828.1 tryptophan--tRNA ligase [Neoehrlichia mikurensis]